MWPWEHLAVGYLCYSAYAHARGRPPRSAAAIAVAVGSQFPDLVDKPLAWSLSVLPSGHSLAHSLLTAAPLAALALLVARAVGRADVGVAFGVGYLSHLAGDVLYPVVLGQPANVDFLLWPLVPAPPASATGGLFTQFLAYFDDYLVRMADPQFAGYFAAELSLLLAVFVLWLYDGAPGFPWTFSLSQQ